MTIGCRGNASSSSTGWEVQTQSRGIIVAEADLEATSGTTVAQYTEILVERAETWRDDRQPAPPVARILKRLPGQVAQRSKARELQDSL